LKQASAPYAACATPARRPRRRQRRPAQQCPGLVPQGAPRRMRRWIRRSRERRRGRPRLAKRNADDDRRQEVSEGDRREEASGAAAQLGVSPTSAVTPMRMSVFKNLACGVGTTFGVWRQANCMRNLSGKCSPRRSNRAAWARSGRTTQRRRSSRGGAVAVGRMMSVLWMAASSWRMVRGLLPRPARLCHCSNVFHST
jgi:hypothetical protein